jgi:hypothetical protein
MHCAGADWRSRILEEAVQVSEEVIHNVCCIRLTFVCRMKEILEPLAIANNVTQACYTHIDHIGLTLGNLYWIYSNSSIEAPICNCTLGSLESDGRQQIKMHSSWPCTCTHGSKAGVSQRLSRLALCNMA